MLKYLDLFFEERLNIFGFEETQFLGFYSVETEEEDDWQDEGADEAEVEEDRVEAEVSYHNGHATKHRKLRSHVYPMNIN